MKSSLAAVEWPKGTEWMRVEEERTGPLFSYMTTEHRIPANHPLRQVRRLADQALDRLKRSLCKPYPESGRPSILPEQLVAGPIAATYDIRQEMMLIEKLDYNLLFSWYVRFILDDCPHWHPTSLTKRLLKNRANSERMVQQH